ncbi:3-methyl-2-oxobutanoate hydroxymethyltransferase [Campylobacter pinnipediorum subsp. caledonicus]|uniref:3-methyl-2-oxobutanoate hydroxymethyltransferase n=1 Tax=Campylobacter pinnipediorum subsp. caledonicus TaxID=1874362 RepID=A0A1S6U621_9BACT|nr:3-methyl-2-oxobutanoate hydroxymethyltransferase [Campylobacter pinnipediorum]AQW87206.1 3-methyl-2-oxobutanoate hydroxymethyltransferase [Campylobacter pinnipediorum subsp. caledonicus]OPA71880.1 3-methyl-2-oxobutanoate hydroxymethyltransferase [Campylobacter pinnipediorum subsp. caledonicus]
MSVYKKITTQDILNKKNNEKIVAITAYDALFAKLFDDYADVILVGDSLNMSFNGQKDTLNVDLKSMLYHTRAVCAGAKRALIMGDMPFGSYQNEKMALKNAVKFIKQAGADCIKLEGGMRVVPTVKKLTEEGVSVCGHIGLMPQRVRFEGGYKIKGKNDDDKKKLKEEALALQDAGAFCIVLEGVISDVANEITRSLEIPTIGIGSGVKTDGQILVFSDMLGFFEEFKPKFVKQYMSGASLVRNAIQEYANEVKNQKFPTSDFWY